MCWCWNLKDKHLQSMRKIRMDCTFAFKLSITSQLLLSLLCTMYLNAVTIKTCNYHLQWSVMGSSRRSWLPSSLLQNQQKVNATFWTRKKMLNDFCFHLKIIPTRSIWIENVMNVSIRKHTKKISDTLQNQHTNGHWRSHNEDPHENFQEYEYNQDNLLWPLSKKGHGKQQANEYENFLKEKWTLTRYYTRIPLFIPD